MRAGVDVRECAVAVDVERADHLALHPVPVDGDVALVLEALQGEERPADEGEAEGARGAEGDAGAVAGDATKAELFAKGTRVSKDLVSVGEYAHLHRGGRRRGKRGTRGPHFCP